jgi:long-chain fatty acid transport protein
MLEYRSLLRLPAVLLLLGVVPAAHASPLSIYGYNPRGVAMGEAQVAAADDASAAFYNPALLTRRDRITFGFGAHLVYPHLDVTPVEWTFDEENAPVLPEEFAQWTLGVMFPLGGRFDHRVSLGIALSLPHGYIVRVQSIDTAQPQFPIYQSSARKIIVLPAIGYRPVDWLAIGGGLQVLASFGGSADVSVDLFTRRVRRRSMLIDLVTKEALVAGVAAGPFHGLTVGFTYRQELGLDFTLPATVDIEDVGTLDLQLVGTTLWSPHELTFGAAWALPDGKTTLAFDMTYGIWSRAPSPQVMVVLDTRGELLEGLGLGGAFDLCSDREVVDPETGERQCVPIPPGYTDNLSPKVGAEYRLFDFLALRAGWRYWPTPVPNQVGRTNYLDASAHHLSTGVGVSFRDPLEVFEQPITLDVSFHAALLRERAVDKGNDGRIAYTFGGALYQAAGALRYQF